MGRDKAWLVVGGRPLLARQIELVRELGAAEIFVSGRPGKDYSEFKQPVLRDNFPDAGPLAGIESALAVTHLPLLLVLAVDLPEMSADFLRRLAACCSETCGAVPKLAKGIEPLAAFYPKVAYPLARASLERGDFAVKDFAGQCAQSGLVRFIEPAEDEVHYFNNWNSPQDLPCMT